MAFSLLPREDQYFDLFLQITSKIKEASAILIEMMAGPYEDHEPASKRIKSVEHECDEITHNITIKLNRSFITPFDREDIYTLSVALDDVCDYIDATARAIVMYDVHEIDENAQQMAVIIGKQATEIDAAVELLKHTDDDMKQHLLEIQRLENDADETYFKAMAALFKNSTDPVDVIKMKELYEILENTTDRCESIGNIIESIMLKHN